MSINEERRTFRAEETMGLAEQEEVRQRSAATRAETDWNLQELLERLDGDREFLCELLHIFREDSETNLQKARTALRQQNLLEVMYAAHTMKGMLRNLSMNRAAEIAFALESASRREQKEQVKALLPQLEQAMSELVPEVDAQLAGVKA